MANEDFQKSFAQAFTRSPAQARGSSDRVTRFSIVTARIPLFGYGPFINSSLNNPGLVSVGSNMFTYSRMLGTMSPNPWYTDAVWPYVYQKCTEQWNETWSDGSSGSKTVVTEYTIYTDLAQPAITTNTTTGRGVTSLAVTSITITSTTFTVNYGGTVITGPGTSATVTGTYVATLSGTILNPGDPGPFNPGDATYGWAALTTLANNLLNNVSTPIPSISHAGIWLTLYPISTGSGYTSSFSADDLDIFGAISDIVMAAANGFPTGGQTSQPMPKSIMDIPSSSPNSQPAGPGQNGENYAYCLSAKSIWNIYGTTGWGDSYSGSTTTSTHATVYYQHFDTSNYNAAGAVGPASTYSSPLHGLVTFTPADVRANTGGAGTYGLLGFQSTAN